MLVIESDWSEIEAGEWRSKISSNAVIGSLLGWAAMGITILMAGDHDRAGRFVSRLLFTAARRRWRESRALLAGLEANEARHVHPFSPLANGDCPMIDKADDPGADEADTTTR